MIFFFDASIKVKSVVVMGDGIEMFTTEICSSIKWHISVFSAINDYKAAEEINGELRRVQEGLKRAQKLLKQSKKRDYYKILGVKR